MEKFETMVRKFVARSIDDPALREALIPDSRYGCRRGLVSDDFHPALNPPNVELIPVALQQVTPSGLLAANQRAIAMRTGFELQAALPFLTGSMDRVSSSRMPGEERMDSSSGDGRTRRCFSDNIRVCVAGVSMTPAVTSDREAAARSRQSPANPNRR